MKLEHFRSIVNEDSKALAHLGTKRIDRNDINPTIKFVSELVGIPRNELHPLGSVGKIADSGDIDLGLDINRYHHQHIDRVIKSHGYEGYYDSNRKVGSYAIPIKGDKENGLVQVDFMFTPNPEWAKFSYFSPGEGSRYKGAVRTVLLTAVAAVLNEPGTDHFQYLENGDLSVRVGRSLDLPSGLKRVFQYRPKNVVGDGYQKQMKSISPEDFKKMHPDVQVKDGKMIIDDPEKVVKTLFGKGVTPNDVESAEQVMHLIKKTFTPDMQKKIFKIASNRLAHLRGKISLPPELDGSQQQG